MSKASSDKALRDFNTVLLINPARYLGNLLIAGGLIQHFHHWCEQHGRQLYVVLDESFRDLVTGSLPESCLLYYPRRQIARASGLQKARLYFTFLHKLRALDADAAFNIEEDSVSHRLTQFCGARHRIGCSTTRHSWGYEQVVPVSFTSRPAERRHRWYSYMDVFAALGMPEIAPAYMQLRPASPDASLLSRLAAPGLSDSGKVVALHAGATKDYKKWPEQSFTALATLLLELGIMPVFIGAGADEAVSARIIAAMPTRPDSLTAVNLCNRLSLPELATFFHSIARGIVGNDSGPFHLAAALNVPGVVMFGPTDVELWRPLSDRSIVMKGTQACDPQCTRAHCLYAHRCLLSISPEMIAEQLAQLLSVPM